jgi:4-amino-4-deoxy-L-arabinose transferase-like glycosyltransferase
MKNYKDIMHSVEKYPLLITLCFFVICAYVSFFHHNYWTFDQDGIAYLWAGNEILADNGKNVGLPNAPIGGPVIYSALNLIFNDGFSVMRAISVISGTGMVFFSYYIIRNIFNSKIALMGQLFFTFNPWLGLYSIQAANELLSIFVIFVSLFFITKKELNSVDVMITGILIGVAFMMRLQVIIILITIIVFLIIKNTKSITNYLYVGLVVTCFLIAASPLFFYNYSTHGNIIDTDSNFYIASHSKYRTIQWVDQLYEGTGKGILYGVFVDVDLFQKNYFYNLFSSLPNNLFYFDITVNSALIPTIPLVSLIPVLGGAIYSLKPQLNKTNIIAIICTASITTLVILLTGDINVHFFAIIIMPILVLGIINYNNSKKNFLPLLILPVVFSFFMSIIPIRAPQHFSLIWISVSVFAGIFFMEIIPKFYSKLRKVQHNKSNIETLFPLKIGLVVLIVIILLLNFVYSFVMFVLKSTDESFNNINKFINLINTGKLDGVGIEVKQIANFLSKQPRIENSYVMTSNFNYPFYAESKWIHVDFSEGPKNDSVENYITRKNWKEWEIYVSNIHSAPMDRQNIYHPIPDYLIIPPIVYSERSILQSHEYLNALRYYDNTEIPENFKVIFRSDRGTIIYKIDHQK